ncbi:protein bicaudal D-like isoform X3 [Biomphalaria glabrata]|uniref:Protein bicaudal D-like isoform X3 n=1 Tax=Biomphalaria glabrata TaxID=6526 RepID=A0A9W3A419_BIOGL|nr:protein bicaudal D-like isoform X3 [Biomphalaria glabrata]
MESPGGGLLSMEDLHAEVERLTKELTETTREKLQAAEYGLAVLEEKQQLQQQFEDLEAQLETTRTELECAKEALNKHHSTFKKHHESGVHQEEKFLEETAQREENYQYSITELEQDLKTTRQNLTRITSENERLSGELAELNHQIELLENQRQQMRHDLREYKVRENRNLTDYAELEEENISLQKQVSQLKQNQVEFESSKHETLRLQGELEDLVMQLDEMAGLKSIVEKKLEEALASLAQEREQKHGLKKELDHRITQESMFNLSNLAHFGGLSEVLNFNHHTDHEEDMDGSVHPALKRIEADFSFPGKKSSDAPTPRPGTVGDILSEIQITEVGKLENLLEQSESEKMELQKALDEAKKLIEDTQRDLIEQKDRADHLKATIAHVAAMHERQMLPNDLQVSYDEGLLAEIADETDPDRKALLELKQNLQQNEKKYTTAMREIGNLQAEIGRLQGRNAIVGNPDIEQALAELKYKCDLYEQTIKDQECNLKAATQAAAVSKNSLEGLQGELTCITEDLAQVYHLVCQVTGDTPSRVMLDHAKGAKIRGELGSSEDITPSSENKSVVDTEKENETLPSQPLSASTPKSSEKKSGKKFRSNQSPSKSDPTSCGTLSETIVDQVKYLRHAIEHLMEMSKQWQQQGNVGGDENGEDDRNELQEQVVKLKAMLSTKREQIATLRSVLKANKSTAEVALANLKQKYENEKVIVTETMMKLRNELKSLKEDAATFASLRAMFAQRCDEYVTQLDEMQRQLSAAEEEKKTLNSLLRMAIQQKLALTQRLEDLEFDRERRTMTTRRQGPPRNNKMGNSKS